MGKLFHKWVYNMRRVPGPEEQHDVGYRMHPADCGLSSIPYDVIDAAFDRIEDMFATALREDPDSDLSQLPTR